jgi:RNA polymerase-binding protein DksA
MKDSFYSEEELKEFKVILIKKKEIAEKQIEDYSVMIEEIAYNGRDEVGLGNSNQDIQLEELIEYKKRAIKHLKNIDNALIRIKNKVYGVCSITGKKIKKERLKVVPTTTKSIEGKTRIQN